MRINEEEIIGDLRTALREFSKPEDLDPSSNQPVTLMNRRGWESTSFRRGDFVLSGSSYIAELLRNYENGGKKALFTIRGVIRLIQETIEMEINDEPVGDTGRMITSIVLLCKKNIFEILGLKKSL